VLDQTVKTVGHYGCGLLALVVKPR